MPRFNVREVHATAKNRPPAMYPYSQPQNQYDPPNPAAPSGYHQQQHQQHQHQHQQHLPAYQANYEQPYPPRTGPAYQNQYNPPPPPQPSNYQTPPYPITHKNFVVPPPCPATQDQAYGHNPWQQRPGPQPQQQQQMPWPAPDHQPQYLPRAFTAPTTATAMTGEPPGYYPYPTNPSQLGVHVVRQHPRGGLHGGGHIADNPNSRVTTHTTVAAAATNGPVSLSALRANRGLHGGGHIKENPNSRITKHHTAAAAAPSSSSSSMTATTYNHGQSSVNHHHHQQQYQNEKRRVVTAPVQQQNQQQGGAMWQHNGNNHAAVGSNSTSSYAVYEQPKRPKKGWFSGLWN